MNCVTAAHQVNWMGGKVPAHWTLFRLKHILLEERKEIGGSAPAGAISFGEVVHKDFDNAETLATYRSVRPAQFLINPLNLNYDLKSLRIALSEIEARVSPAYIVATNIKQYANAQYLRWALRVFDVQHIKTLGAGVRQTVSFEDIGNCTIALPNLEEQSEIAAYLDRETKRIDGLIAKKTRFVELLREKRRALSTHAVTKGLRAGVGLKYSGAEWLGMVPAHWDIKPFWAIYRPKKETGYPKETLLSVYRDHGVIEKNSRDDNKNRASEDLTSYQLVVKGDLVTNKMKAWQGSIAVSSLRGIVSPAYYVYRKVHCESDSFLHHLFRSAPYITGYRSVSKGIRVGQWDLDSEKFRLFPVLIPPKDEQQEIVDHIQRSTSQIDALMSKTDQSIEMLRERRMAVITAAVTGKIDLREAA